MSQPQNNPTPNAIVSAQQQAVIDETWQNIIEQLATELSEGDLPEQVIAATEYLLAGWPTYKIAKQLKTNTATIRRWLSQYPTMAAVVAKGRELLQTWRMAKLEQQFLTAIERSQEILEVNLDGSGQDGHRVDSKVLPVVAAQARYVIGLFAGQRMDITVTHELGDSVLKAQREALDYLASQINDDRPIEAVYRVIDNKIDNSGPVVDEHGRAPFGEMGILDTNDAGTLCHACGNRYHDLPKHLLTKHLVTVQEYELTYMLSEGSVRNNVKAPNPRED